MTLSINDLLETEGLIDDPGITALHGPFGLHGGLSAALLLHRMRAHAPADRNLVAMTTSFLRPLGASISITAESTLNGSFISAVNASASTNGKVGLQARAVFAAPQEPGTPEFAPPFPDGLPHWSDIEPLSIPPEFSPIAARMEIRPAMAALPYSGADQPILCGWIRLKDEVPAADERLVLLADAVGPSYTAVLRAPKATPTIELSVQLSAAASHTEFDRVLVRAETTSADARGWLSESIDVWNPDGVHLATAHQVRVVR